MQSTSRRLICTRFTSRSLYLHALAAQMESWVGSSSRDEQRAEGVIKAEWSTSGRRKY